MSNRTISYIEDFARQIEILPIENLDFCRMQLGEIGDFSTQHQTDMGWEDIYLRGSHPHPLEEFGLTLQDLRDALEDILPEYDQTEFYFGATKMECENTIAFGRDGGPALFADFDEAGVISLLWCDNPLSELPDLPWAKKLLYVDWDRDFLCPLNDRETFLAHFNKQESLRLETEAKYGSQKKRPWWKFW